MRIQSKTQEQSLKRGTTWLTETRSVFILPLIGGEGGASFLNQSRGRKVKQKEDNSLIALHSYLEFNVWYHSRKLCVKTLRYRSSAPEPQHSHGSTLFVYVAG